MKTYSVSGVIIASLLLGICSTGFRLDIESTAKHTSVNSSSAKTAGDRYHFLTSLSNSYSGGGYHGYGRQTIDLTGRSGSVGITFYVAAVPNRFTYYDGSGNYIDTSGWVGDANYQGPWGSSLHKGPNTFTVYFSGGASYGIDVETVTNPDAGARSTDYWEIDY